MTKAEEFIAREKQFQLGFLPTECSNPLTKTLEADFRRSAADGVATLQRPDREVAALAAKVFESKGYQTLCAEIAQVWKNGKRVVFSGCGATGRLAILLESMCREAGVTGVASIMTGGDYALIRAVEFFEDYAAFGARQAEELKLGPGDLLIAITEGGETSSVLGSLARALDLGCAGFLVFNNPADILAEKLERSRKMITDPRVRVIELYSGSMAIAGSTRMQATTAELLVVGGALCHALGCRLDLAQSFNRLLDELESPRLRQQLANYIKFEADSYQKNQLLTYFADDYLLDLFTDTAERSPTFMLPAFCKQDDRVSPPSWAYVKHLTLDSRAAWSEVFRREPRCLDWHQADYEAMDAARAIAKGLPRIGPGELYKFDIGNGRDAARLRPGNTAILFQVGEASEKNLREFERVAADFEARRVFAVITGQPLAATPLRLFEHLLVKLVWNTVSTGTMVLAGRVSGNWMSFVATTNKKLVDRAIRLVAELGNLPYADAAEKIFDAMDALEQFPPDREKPSAVQYVLKNLK